MDIHLAILQLGKNNNEYTVTDDCSKIREWRGSDPQPTETELTEAWTAYQAAAAAVKYKDDRKKNGSITYPAIGDQLDLLWHAIDADADLKVKFASFYNSIKAVKDANPKP